MTTISPHRLYIDNAEEAALYASKVERGKHIGLLGRSGSGR